MENFYLFFHYSRANRYSNTHISKDIIICPKVEFPITITKTIEPSGRRDFHLVFFSKIFWSFSAGGVLALDTECLTCSTKENEERI